MSNIFDLHTSEAYKAVKYPVRVVVPGQIVFTLLSVLFFLFFLFPKPNLSPTDFSPADALGLFLVCISVNVWFLFFWMFYLLRLRHVPEPLRLDEVWQYVQKGGQVNAANYLDLAAVELFYKADLYARRKNIAVDPIVLLHGYLKTRRSDFMFSRMLINKTDFEKSVEIIVNSQFQRKPDETMHGAAFDAVVLAALEDAAQKKYHFITLDVVVRAIVARDMTIQKIFFDFGVKKDDVMNVSEWEEHYHFEHEVAKPFLFNFRGVKGLADDWVYGYTLTLDAYAHDIAVHSLESAEHTHIHAKEDEIGQVETILAQSGRNNVVLIGEAGVGKKSVVAGFAQRILYGTTLPPLKHKRLVELDVNRVLARSRDAASAIALFEKILAECERAGNVILVIDNLDHVIGPQRREQLGAVDFSSVLIPHLQSEHFQLIALTDPGSFHAHIEAVPSVAVLLSKVEVPELNEAETLEILEDIAPKLERRSGLFISYFALAEVVSAAGSFIQNVPFPEKAISLLSEVLSYVSSHALIGNVVTQDHVTEVISKKTGIPLGRIEGEEKAKLLNMEELLHNRIIGQDQAVKHVAAALRRIRSGITERKRPIGTFLFLGPTGVGKTETAKALAAVYFGSDERMIRLDMTEYQEAASINRLIGNADTAAEAQFANAIRENPFSLVVLDELEKAHPNVMNLFLQILDEGRLTDAFEKKVSFKNTIIIATSNAGAEFIREYVKTGQNLSSIATRLLEHLMKSSIFKPEFLNRFDATIVFSPLTMDEVKQIAALMLRGLAARLENKGYVVTMEDALADEAAKRGFDQIFGARELRRFIQEKLENVIADRIIKGEYKEGDTISLTVTDLT
ncbi:hypothetical protein A2988_04200 [Candidatus Azambacteria bacterium RIFCSPLOWO2_01_FULL_46_25]|uniref:Clp R domain-containing protein n=1 Tax=Candidatus Azambacteria bacterium RIFCSPLOWO2_01_FULL_46_25 TaxID=1797298 RepID=A0A1F5BVN0_9BACT|nr:MAG: hypothetical protein A2988_04200 [Candidatus Azambacteria bacterium RIFCSPLOWO2_01_FULL_46_25]OGD37443.1 MAG: hypothetical protein A2850_02630 [Candidatus Azambacteria bacterium RIFCSPHIGHO2_01_FULL_51_74]